MTTFAHISRWLTAALVAVAAVGCGSDSAQSTPTAPTGPVTEQFASVVVDGGATSRTITMHESGTVTLTLAPTPLNYVVGLGIGTRSVAGTICSLAVSVLTAGGGTGPQISIPADAGTYCVQVFDIGNLPPKTQLGFSLTMVHPS